MNTSVLLPSLGELSINWWRVLMDAGEMFNATTQVVGHRSARMALAGPMPNERDRYEFRLMSREKVEAASESIEALRSGFLNLSLEFVMETDRQMWAASAAILALGSSHTAAQWHESQAVLLKIATEYPTHPLQLANSTARVMQEGLAPIHGRATANAERLGAI
jgi:hypothetical protein